MSMLAGQAIKQQIVAMSLTDAVRQAIRCSPGSLRALARASGVDVATLSRILSGQRVATPEVARKLADALERWSRETKEAARRIRRSFPRNRR